MPSFPFLIHEPKKRGSNHYLTFLNKVHLLSGNRVFQMKVNLLKLRTFPPSLKLSLGSTEFLQFEAKGFINQTNQFLSDIQI